MKLYILFALFSFAVAHSEEKCGQNQHYNECGTACPITCDNYEDPPLTCIRICVPGCHCNEDYVLTDDRRCVKPEECPTNNSNDYSVKSSIGACNLPAEPGLCDALIPRYYYDSIEGKCELFMYGGCGGNKNNFRTLEECQNTCGMQREINY